MNISDCYSLQATVITHAHFGPIGRACGQNPVGIVAHQLCGDAIALVADKAVEAVVVEGLGLAFQCLDLGQHAIGMPAPMPALSVRTELGDAPTLPVVDEAN